MKRIRICEPEIVKGETYTRLQSEIISDAFSKILYFEVDNKYADYLCYERSDAFLVALLYFAMVNEYNIVCDSSISERLYYQIVYTYIPTVTKNDPELYHSITITATTLDSSPIQNKGAVGASVTGGVDSFYTILKNLDSETKDYNITHLLLTNCFNIYYGEEDTRKRFSEICRPGLEIADELGLEFVGIYSNIHEFWYPHFADLYCLRYCAMPYALQKLFSVYNYSSGYQYKDFTFKAGNRDASHHDCFTVHLVSNENITFYSSGGEASRAEKAEYISDSKVVQHHFQVCNNNHKNNCGVCEKCLRSQLNLYACGKLNYFTSIFDIDLFYKNLRQALVDTIARDGDFDREILEMLNRNGIKIKRIDLFKGRAKKTLIFIKSRARGIKPLYNIYRLIKGPSYETETDREKYDFNYEFAKECDPGII